MSQSAERQPVEVAFPAAPQVESLLVAHAADLIIGRGGGDRTHDLTEVHLPIKSREFVQRCHDCKD